MIINRSKMRASTLTGSNPQEANSSMQAIVIHAARDLRIEDRDCPGPGSQEVQIQLATGGICGSDLHYFNHGGFGDIRLKEPMILGHEVSGYVTEVGEGVENLSSGQLVAVSPSRPCRSCSYCQEGKHNHCLNMRFYGSAMPFPHIQGAFQQILIADASQCAPAEGLTTGEAAMAEPLAVALHACHQAGNLLGKKVLITGCGPIGALCAITARRAGAAEITGTDLSTFTLDKAIEVGADRALNVASDPGALIPFCDGKGYFDVLFECTGNQIALANAIAAMRPGGIIVQLGLGGDMELPVQAITAKELQLRGAFRFHEEFFSGVHQMKNRQIDVKPLITHTLPLIDATAAFELASDRTQTMKAHLDFSAA